MFRIEELSKEEISYICSQVSFSAARHYFQKNSRKYAEIKPGFRAEKLSDQDTCTTLIENSNTPFISSFLNMAIERWLSEIKQHIDDFLIAAYS